MRKCETPDCYPATACVPTPVSICSDRDLLDLVGRMCGDDIRDILEARLGETPVPAGLHQQLRQAVDVISGAIREIENELDAVLMIADASACKTIGDLVDLVEEEL